MSNLDRVIESLESVLRLGARILKGRRPHVALACVVAADFLIGGYTYAKARLHESTVTAGLPADLPLLDDVPQSRRVDDR